MWSAEIPWIHAVRAELVASHEHPARRLVLGEMFAISFEGFAIHVAGSGHKIGRSCWSTGQQVVASACTLKDVERRSGSAVVEHRRYNRKVFAGATGDDRNLFGTAWRKNEAKLRIHVTSDLIEVPTHYIGADLFRKLRRGVPKWGSGDFREQGCVRGNARGRWGSRDRRG